MKNGNAAFRESVAAAEQSKGESNELLPHQRELIRKKELLSKVQAGRQKIDRTQFGAVTAGDPAMHYSWVNQRPESMVIFEGLGYEVCRDPKVETRFKRGDGTHVRGDLILMQVSKEVYEQIQAEDDYRAIEALQDPHEIVNSQVINAIQANQLALHS